MGTTQGPTPAAAVPQMTHAAHDGCSFVRVQLPPGTHVDVSRVFHDEVSLIAFSGAAWQSRQAGRTHLEVPGTVVMRDAGQVFDVKSLSVDEVTGADCREIHLSPRRLKGLLATAEGGAPAMDFSDPVISHSGLHDLLLETHRLYAGGGCTLARETCLASLAIGLAQVTSGRPLRFSLKDCPRRHARVVEYMRSNYARSITLEELATLADTNPFVLIRQFRREYGVTPHEYLRVFRVNKARAYIQQGFRLAEVAAMCGFSDQSHMTRQFKRTVGVTPGQFIALRN
ncbi:AraC family transcriptional regulator [Azorhizobium oxalatiphilum]|uniref:AraC family transcriptional regulator n=1 Tax=Azorhizobium oxalatiphilum TaxID=980631 RepID=A0A917FHR2_9HYPH|nr:AraC family transcriptional regulator [Azorhizobium oxalatiphilum]GGF77447.1 AraC family transcriptional regulator [Azorhizobium oxalatiphilum]